MVLRILSFSTVLLSASAFRARPNQKKQKASLEVAAGGKVVTLGDSYSSGTGIHKSGRDYEGGDCWRDWKTTPGSQFAAFEGLQGINLACKGDEVPGIKAQFDRMHAENPADAAIGWANSTILFTIGGNDLRTVKGESWPGLLKSCIMSFYGACHEKQENQIANWDQLQATLTDLYTDVVQKAPNARIRVMGYPRLMQRSLLCLPVPGLALGAADWADRQVDELNNRLLAAVNAVKATALVELDADEDEEEAPAALVQEASTSGNSVLDKLRQKATAKLNGKASTKNLDAAVQRKGSRRRRTRRRRATPAPTPTPGMDLEFVDVKSYYNRGACRITRREVHSIVLDGFSLSDSSFHPSQRGYNKYYEALGNSLGRSLPPLRTPPEIVDPDSLLNVLQGWDSNQNGTIELDEALAMMVEDNTPGVAEQLTAAFRQADTAGTGSLNLDQFENFMELFDAAAEE